MKLQEQDLNIINKAFERRSKKTELPPSELAVFLLLQSHTNKYDLLH